jgi:hypothetical protein
MKLDLDMGFLDCKLVKTAMDPRKVLNASDGDPLEGYYTRRNIMFTVHQLI